jgi:hypothetical protein
MNRHQEILDEAICRLIERHKEEYESIKWQLNREYDKHGGILQ